MHQAKPRSRLQLAFVKPSRCGHHRFQALAIQRPRTDLAAFAHDVDAMHGRRLAVAADQPQQRLRQTRMIDGKILIEEVVAILRQRLPMLVSYFQLQQPHAAFMGTKSFLPVNAAMPPQPSPGPLCAASARLSDMIVHAGDHG